MNRSATFAVIEETHGYYDALRAGRNNNTDALTLY